MPYLFQGHEISLLDIVIFMSSALIDFYKTDGSLFQIKRFTLLLHFKEYTAMKISTSYHIYESGFITYRLYMYDTNTCLFPGLH